MAYFLVRPRGVFQVREGGLFIGMGAIFASFVVEGEVV